MYICVSIFYLLHVRWDQRDLGQSATKRLGNQKAKQDIDTLTVCGFYLDLLTIGKIYNIASLLVRFVSYAINPHHRPFVGRSGILFIQMELSGCFDYK